MRIVKLAVVGVLMIPGWRVADAAKDCTAEKTAGRQAFDEEIKYRLIVSLEHPQPGLVSSREA